MVARVCIDYQLERRYRGARCLRAVRSSHICRDVPAGSRELRTDLCVYVWVLFGCLYSSGVGFNYGSNRLRSYAELRISHLGSRCHGALLARRNTCLFDGHSLPHSSVSIEIEIAARSTCVECR